MFAYSHNIKLFYQIEGEGRGIPLVFINSLGCDLSIWDDVVKPWLSEYRIVRYDTRGHGHSQAPAGPYTLADHTNDLAGLLDILGISKALLVGISVGGLIAMDYALSRPAAVTALVLCDTAPRIGSRQIWRDRIRSVREQGLEKMAKTIIERWFTTNFSHSHLDLYQNAFKMLQCNSQDGYIATCAALRDANLSGLIQSITVPVMAVCGAEDHVVTPTQTREWAARFPRARVEVIPGAAHLPCIEQPAALAQVIQAFLKEGGYA